MHGFRWLVLLIPFLVGCSCNENLSDASGAVVADPAAIDFGDVYLGDSSPIEVEFRNNGRTVVTLRAADVPAFFHLAPATLELAPGSSAKWTFLFSPEQVGPAEGTAGIGLVGATNEKLEVAVRGVGLSRETALTEIDFGLVPLGESRTLPFPVKSDSAGALDVELALVGGEPGAFSLASTSIALDPGASGSVDLRFAPDRRGEVHTWVEVRTCRDCNPQRVRAIGTGAVERLEIYPNGIDFGQTSPGGVKMESIKLTNDGDLPIEIGSAALITEGRSAFQAELGIFPLVLEPGESRSVEVSFRPPAGMPFDEQLGSVRFYGLHERDLHGEVLLRGAPGGPELVVSPESIDFGLQPIGVPRTVRVTVRNAGQPANVKVVGRHFGGGQPGAFFVHEEQVLPAEVGSSTVSFDVGFQPGAAGEFATELAILTDDDERGVLLVPINGRARVLPPCDLVVAPSVLRFGLVANRGEHLRSAAIKNVGADECMIWDVRLAADGSPFFATAGTPTETTVIPAGGRLDLTVRFTPNGIPDVLATSELSFAHTSASAPRMVIPVSALPSRYDLEARPNPMDLGSWPMGYRNLASLTVTNRGAFTATLSNATTSGTTSAEIAVNPAYGVPGALVGDAVAGLHVGYAPADAGMDQGEVEIWIAGASEPFLVAVAGQGKDEECGLPCAGPAAFCPAPVITNANSSVILAGAGTDPGGDPLTCSWTVDSAPFGSSAAAQSPAQCTTAFTPDLVGDYRMRLTVRDPMGNTGTCITEVRSNPFGGLWVEMFWSPAGDIDLHVLHSGGGSPLVYSSWLDQIWSCFYSNCKVTAPTTLAWDTPGPNDDPTLDVDSISGTGPENIKIMQPSSSHPYRVGFKNFNNRNAPVSVTYNVYCGGVQVHGQTYQSSTVGEIFYVGDVLYNATSGCTFTANGTIVNP